MNVYFCKFCYVEVSKICRFVGLLYIFVDWKRDKKLCKFLTREEMANLIHAKCIIFMAKTVVPPKQFFMLSS